MNIFAIKEVHAPSLNNVYLHVNISAILATTVNIILGKIIFLAYFFLSL